MINQCCILQIASDREAAMGMQLDRVSCPECGRTVHSRFVWSYDE